MRLMTIIGFILISLLSATAVWGASSYSYDALGNMRGYVIDDYRHARHLTLDYSYDARNRLIHFVNERGGSFDQTYDSYGRITTGHNRLTQYDHSHRPTSVTHNGGRQYDFVFDGNLHRARETIAEVTSYSVYSAGTLLLRDNITDGEQTDYVRLGRHTIARLKTDSAGVTTVTYPHANHLGSPVAATDANGALLWREEYTPFGRKHENITSERGEEGFTGHIFDGQNTVHMKARTYMTTAYRFTTPDPVTFLSSGLDPAYFNRYAYVANDPVNNIDPDGRQSTALASPFLRSLGNPKSKARQTVRVGIVAGSVLVPGPEDVVIAAAGATKVGQSVASAVGKVAGGNAKSAKVAQDLNKQLTSDEQVAELISGAGEEIAGGASGKAFRDAGKIADEIGAEAGDLSKVSSSARTRSDGTKVSTHGIRNNQTGEVTHMKTKIEKTCDVESCQ